jgi:primosomal replication protein N
VDNQVVLTACIAEAQALRYTPAGLPALDMRLEHESQQTEQGQRRIVKAVLKGVAFGALAERLARQSLGSKFRFQGFLVTPRNAKSVVLHIQDIQQD